MSLTICKYETIRLQMHRLLYLILAVITWIYKSNASLIYKLFWFSHEMSYINVIFTATEKDTPLNQERQQKNLWLCTPIFSFSHFVHHHLPHTIILNTLPGCQFWHQIVNINQWQSHSHSTCIITMPHNTQNSSPSCQSRNQSINSLTICTKTENIIKVLPTSFETMRHVLRPVTTFAHNIIRHTVNESNISHSKKSKLT